jgi:hypothetical protein
MRALDLSRLSKPYPDDHDSTADPAMSALGIPLRRWKELEAVILDDFVEHPPYGIGWWAPSPGTSRRILISDQLYACIAGVSANMVEAVLHWLEYQDFAERDSERFADVVQRHEGQVVMSLPRPRNALEELSGEMVVMHIVGMARALCAALDCLAGAVIGVLAIPTPILKADLNDIKQFFTKIGQGKTDGERAQVQFHANFKEVIATVGPNGWLDWVLAFRNMLVHRGRRLFNGQFVQKEPTLYGPDGHPLLRARRLTFLPRDPIRSDVEVWRESPTGLHNPLDLLVLGEDAGQTLGGLLESTKALIRDTAKLLVDGWNWRRDNPQILPQPVAQWPKGAATQVSVFQGYAPRPRDLPPMTGILHPIVSRRFRAAALDDASRTQWNTFD